MEATAKATYVRISPRKVQIVLDLIRNQPADKAMAILQYTPKAACEPVMKVLKSAIANAENNNNMDTSRFRQEHRAELTESIREHHTSQLPLRNWKTKRGGKLNGTEM